MAGIEDQTFLVYFYVFWEPRGLVWILNEIMHGNYSGAIEYNLFIIVVILFLLLLFLGIHITLGFDFSYNDTNS